MIRRIFGYASASTSLAIGCVRSAGAVVFAIVASASIAAARRPTAAVRCRRRRSIRRCGLVRRCLSRDRRRPAATSSSEPSALRCAALHRRGRGSCRRAGACDRRDCDPGALRRRLFVVLVLGFFRLGAQQRLTIGDRDLVVVGMNFAESEEAMAVSAILDECSLKGRFDARYARQIDVSFKLFLVLQIRNQILRCGYRERRQPVFPPGGRRLLAFCWALFRFPPAAASRSARRNTPPP